MIPGIEKVREEYRETAPKEVTLTPPHPEHEKADVVGERALEERVRNKEHGRHDKARNPDNNPPKEVVLDYKNPLGAAGAFAAYMPHLRYWQNSFYRYEANAYRQQVGQDIKAKIYSFLAGAVVSQDDKKLPYRPNRNRVGEVLDALQAKVNLEDHYRPPCWLNGEEAPENYLAVGNGLLHLTTKELRPPTPAFFTLNALSFGFDRSAAPPIEWSRFLKSIWPGDEESIDTLQEIMGYLLTSDTSQQKIFSIVGPMRSGKGTIGRIINALLGPDNVAAPTLGSLAREFGLAALIGKKAAVISDARLSAKADQAAIAERLLSISGEDHQGIARKYLTDYHGPLPVRFVILSNELPRLADASGALPSRFVLLSMTKSFLGKEDQGLTKRLMAELPAILNWALDGLDRLRQRGYFKQPASGAEAVREIADLSSPIGAFIRDCCEVEPGTATGCKLVYEAWCKWCTDQGREYPGTLQSFGRDLRAAVPGVETTQKRVSEGRIRMYEGIGLR